MSCGTMDLAPLFCVDRVMEWSLLLLIRGLLLVIPSIPMVFMIFAISVISVVFVIPVISPISYVDLPIVLLLLRGPLAT
jgi:hypothetical protein